MAEKKNKQYENLVSMLRKKYNLAPLVMEAADAIEDLSDLLECYEGNTEMALVEEDRMMVVRFLPKWIPVTERLPAIRHNVLIMTAKGGVAEGEYAGEGWLQYRWSMHMGKDAVTHWRPLPEPPRQEA